MDRHKRSYTLARTLVLGSATLAIVGVLFALYNSMSVAPAVRPAKGGPAARVEPAGPEPGRVAHATRANGQASGGGVRLPEGIQLAGGSEGVITLYEPGSDRVRAELRHQGWEPVSGSDNQFKVTMPRISLRTPNGQLVEVRARTGLIQLAMDAGDRPDLRHGTLTGGVEIKVDRLDDRQRAALPEEERHTPGPDRLITMRLDDVNFDREYARLTTAGRFSIESVEAQVAGQGLSLRYNEVDSSVEHLKIDQAGRIVVRGLGRMLEVGLPGDEPEAVAKVTAEPTVAVKPDQAPPPPTGGSADRQPATTPAEQQVPVLALDRGEADKVHRTVRYQAEFSQDVQVRELEGEVVTGELLADVLQVMFAFGQRERDAAQARTSPAEAGGDAEQGSEATPPGTELTVTWSGPLEVRAVEVERPLPAGQSDGPAPPALDTARRQGPAVSAAGGRGTRPGARTDDDVNDADAPQRLQVTATGEEVLVRQKDRGTVRCAKLVYDEGNERVYLYGRPGAPAVIDASDGGQLEGPEIALDMQAGTARIVGPGRMSDRRARRAVLEGTHDGTEPRHQVDISFDDEVNVAFASTTVEATDAETGQTVPKRRRYLETAVFEGAVSMAQGDDRIAGERVELSFGPPRRPEAFADSIRRLQAEGSVLLAHGDESVRCQRIDVEMDLDEGGHVAPRRAQAYGDVSACRGERTITARDSMNVELRSFRVEREPWDLNQARAEALRRGIDPQQVDWEEQRAKYERQDRFRPGVKALDAYGGVTARDPEQNLDVTAETLQCTFQDGRKIDQALVMGSDASPAHVEMKDYAVTGREVELDVPNESAEVPGRGRLAFRSQRDLDGRELDQPLPVVVTWSESMVYRGVQQRAIITGSVHAATEQSTFDCGELTIDFAERRQESPISGPAARPGGRPGARDEKIDWWVFAPVAKRVAAAFADKPQETFLEDDFNKEPVQLLATGGAVALTSKTERGTGRVLSRGRIAGPRIFVDLRTEAMTVEGAGDLLIEDYELPGRPETQAAPGASLRTPFGGLGVDSPSQTLLVWTGEMIYHFGQGAAIFDRGVEMSHRSGTEIILGTQVVSDAAFSAAIESGQKQGRRSWLACQRLGVEFGRPEEAGRPGLSGAGDMSGYELSRFEATGQVHFEDSGVVVLAEQVAFDADRNWLSIRGQQGQHATIYDQRGKFQEIKAEVIEWNRESGRVFAPNASVVGR